MIVVTRLDRREVALNCDLIESVDARPDTTIRLVTGQSLVVRESVSEVVERIRAWRIGLIEGAGLASLLAGQASPVLHAELGQTLERLADDADLLELAP